jgi:FO synthase
MMLESTSTRLLEKGGRHHGSVGKVPQTRIATLAEAGRLSIPFTTGILIGIGETREDRIESLLVIKGLLERFGHIQEVIVQSFQPKPETRMTNVSDASFDDLLWMAAAARLILGPAMNIHVPPNLSYERFPELLEAGINEWGGVSPVTPDHVNPEAVWPALDALRDATAQMGFSLLARLPLDPSYMQATVRWTDPALVTPLLRTSDAEGWARAGQWSPGLPGPPKIPAPALHSKSDPLLDSLLTRAQ